MPEDMTPHAPIRHKFAANGKPEISIITAVFNTERYIEEALASILAQKRLEFEIVAVDDGSTDSSLSRMLEVNDDRLTVLSFPQNVGLYHARNAAIEHCRAPWIMIFDSDDIMVPDCLAAYVRAAESSGRLWAYCWLSFIDSEGRDMGIRMSTPFDLLKLLQRNIAPDPMSLVKRDALIEMGGYRTRFRISESYDLRLRLLERGDPFCYPRVCVRYRRHDTNITVERQDPAHEILRQWKADLCSRMHSGRHSDRVGLLHCSLQFLDAFSERRWSDAVAIADRLLEAGLVSVEVEQRLIIALRECGNARRALDVALHSMGRADARFLPAETAWLMGRAVELAAMTRNETLLGYLRQSAEHICKAMNDKGLEAVLKTVYGRPGEEMACPGMAEQIPV